MRRKIVSPAWKMALLFAATCTGTPDGVETATGALTASVFQIPASDA